MKNKNKNKKRKGKKKDIPLDAHAWVWSLGWRWWGVGGGRDVVAAENDPEFHMWRVATLLGRNVGRRHHTHAYVGGWLHGGRAGGVWSVCVCVCMVMVVGGAMGGSVGVCMIMVVGGWEKRSVSVHEHDKTC